MVIIYGISVLNINFYGSNGVIRESYVKVKVISFTLDGHIYAFMRVPFPAYVRYNWVDWSTMQA